MEFTTNPSLKHHEAVDRVLRYLSTNRHLAIEYSANVNEQQVFSCSSDAAFADHVSDRKSSEGYLFKVYGGPIDWRATKQKTVTTSSTEAELLAISHAAKEVVAWQRFFRSIRFDPGHPVTLSCDNQQTIRLLACENPLLPTKLRHVDVHQHWLRQEVLAGNLHVTWVPTAEMPSDGLTKSLSRQKHERFVNLLGLVDISDKLSSAASS